MRLSAIKQLRRQLVNKHMPIYLGDHAIEKFIQFCKAEKHERFLLVADENTYKVLGAKVHAAIQQEDWDVQHIVLNPEGLHADSEAISRVFAVYDGQPRLFVAIGSGTITDTARFTSHRSRNSFVSFPTAASVDAYTSVNAPVTISGLKGSIYCQAPVAIFTDLPTIVSSPKWLTASGFGDLVSKFTSSADWKFSYMILGTEFIAEIYERARKAAQTAAEMVDGIAEHAPESMAAMMRAQFESGFCMADFGNSAPASGGEHHIAHIWEMMFHWEGREGLYHGNAVGVATIIEAEWFERLRATSKEEARMQLERVDIPSREVQMNTLQQVLPEIAEELIEKNPIYMQLAEPQVLARIKKSILDRWEEIQAVAELVPPAEQFRNWFKKIGAPTTTMELGISAEQSRIARDFGHYLRERFSMNIIRHLFGWE